MGISTTLKEVVFDIKPHFYGGGGGGGGDGTLVEYIRWCDLASPSVLALSLLQQHQKQQQQQHDFR